MILSVLDTCYVALEGAGKIPDTFSCQLEATLAVIGAIEMK